MKNLNLKENPQRIGFISTRFAGTDGVSLETQKWSHVMSQIGLEPHYLAGKIDMPPEVSMLSSLCDFKHTTILEIHDQCFGSSNRSRAMTQLIQDVKRRLKDVIYEFVEHYEIDMLCVQNALAIPMNVPLGIALTEYIAETGIYTIAHHHDFFWERKRFLVNSIWEYLNMAFPPHLNSVQHVVINSSGANQLALRTGISSTTIPNVMDYDNPPATPDGYADDIRQALGMAQDDIFILQPTRIVQRKGIEHAIELAHLLGDKAKIVVSHDAGDEGQSYLDRIMAYADTLDVELIIASGIANHKRGTSPEGKKIYSLEDLYESADLVTFPSVFEGFGNAFLEAIYFRKPLLVNNYSVYATDIRTKGFWNIEIDDYITDETVEFTRKVLQDERLRQDMVDHNYNMARRYFSYTMLREKIESLLGNFYGSNY